MVSVTTILINGCLVVVGAVLLMTMLTPTRSAATNTEFLSKEDDRCSRFPVHPHCECPSVFLYNVPPLRYVYSADEEWLREVDLTDDANALFAQCQYDTVSEAYWNMMMVEQVLFDICNSTGLSMLCGWLEGVQTSMEVLGKVHDRLLFPEDGAFAVVPWADLMHTSYHREHRGKTVEDLEHPMDAHRQAFSRPLPDAWQHVDAQNLSDGIMSTLAYLYPDTNTTDEMGAYVRVVLQERGYVSTKSTKPSLAEHLQRQQTAAE